MAIVKRLLIIGTSLLVASASAVTQDVSSNNEVIQRIAKELNVSAAPDATATGFGAGSGQSVVSASGNASTSQTDTGSASAPVYNGTSPGGTVLGGTGSLSAGTVGGGGTNAGGNALTGNNAYGLYGSGSGSASSYASEATATGTTGSYATGTGESGSAFGDSTATLSGGQFDPQSAIAAGSNSAVLGQTRGSGSLSGQEGQNPFDYAAGQSALTGSVSALNAATAGNQLQAGIASSGSAADGAMSASSASTAAADVQGNLSEGNSSESIVEGAANNTASSVSASSAYQVQSSGNTWSVGAGAGAGMLAQGKMTSQSTQSIAPTYGNVQSQAAIETFRPVISEEQQVIHELAFKNLLQREMPMSPQQVVQLHSMYNQSQKAAAVYPGLPPTPVSTSMQVNLSPGAPQPVINLQAGFVTSLVFLDSTGAPWPIESYDLGNPRDFDIQWDKKSNILMVQAKALYKYANMAVKFKELQTPLMIMLAPASKQFFYRVDVRLPGVGPEASALPLSNGLPEGANPKLLSLLDGIAPDNARYLTVSGGVADAWLSYGHVFLRTRLTVLSPGWIGKMTSADGMNAYELQPTSAILATVNGHLVHLSLKGF